MKKLIPLVLAACLLFTGCTTWLDGYYSHVIPFEGSAGEKKILSKFLEKIDFSGNA